VRAQWIGVEHAVPPHDHTYHEISLILDGSAVHRCASHGRSTVQSGAAIVMPPGAVHAFDGPRGLRVVNIYYLAEWLAADLSSLWSEGGLVPLFLSASVTGPSHGRPARFDLTADEMSAITFDLRDIEAESAARIPSRALMRGAFIKVLVRMTRAAARTACALPRHRAEVQRAIDEIERLVASASPFDVTALAASTALSSDYLGRLFHGAMGRSPIDYYQLRRVQRACQLLTDPTQSVTAIALDLGYADTPHLCRMFKRYRHMSPTAYRAMYG
jgi:AraC-like DNA-binding protein